LLVGLLLAIALPVGATDVSRSKIHAGPADVWDDLQVPTLQAIGASSLTAVSYRDTVAKIASMSSTGTDALTFFAQMPHRWKITTAVKPHIHWIPLVAPGAPRVVRFTGLYAWADITGTLPANASWTTFTADVNIAAGDEFKHEKTAIATAAPGAAAAASSILVVHLVRDGASVTDTYTDGGPSNVGILSVDVHYQSSTFGTVGEFQ
jgi:hypothetical protein